MKNIITSIDPNGLIHFNQAEIYNKIIAAHSLAGLYAKEMYFVHRGITVKVGPQTRVDRLFCSWLMALATNTTTIGPDPDPLVIEKIVERLRATA